MPVSERTNGRGLTCCGETSLAPSGAGGVTGARGGRRAGRPAAGLRAGGRARGGMAKRGQKKANKVGVAQSTPSLETRLEKLGGVHRGAERRAMLLPRASSKAHWVSDARVTHCAYPGCGKVFSMRIRRHHCRMCGLVFCEEHSSRRLRLGADSRPNDGGEPQRVCEGCFRKAQAPPEERESSPSAGTTALRLHVAGEVTAREVTDRFRARRAAYNAEKRRAAIPLVDAYVRLCQADQHGPFSSKRVVEWEADRATAGAHE